jgi:UDP-N-acetylmuramoyl-L-alanyl-D-glutamate--2,6-diaminopimelate ligase
MMKLGHILRDLPDRELSGNEDVEIKGLAYDSRQVKPGYVFVALRGHRLDGHDYIPEAIRRGAVAVVAEAFTGVEGQVARVKVAESRKALSKLAVQFYGSPFNGMNLIGITGTNGKTTTSYLLESILQVAGAKPGVLGTITYRFSGKIYPAPVTTPESLDVMRLMREMADGGVTDVIMEVSSHALDQGRVKDCPFRVAIFTNLSRDHLDYHKTMDEYFRAKSLLFVSLGKSRPGYGPHAVINVDDPYGRELVAMTGATVWTYGLGKRCRVRGELISSDRKGIHVKLTTPAGDIAVRSSLLGHFNHYNIMGAAAAGLALNLSLETIAEGIARLKAVPGRLELVKNHRSLTLVVDYSHTPDALLKAMQTLRSYGGGRLITVFGCGGDRDRGKRYDMGLLAAEHSDLVFITSDNPRSEDPLSIVKQIEEGTKKAGLNPLEWPVSNNHVAGGYFLEVDRREAIRKAVSLADQKDIVLIAGKGHEDYQIIGKEKRHFDDREEAAQAASERK